MTIASKRLPYPGLRAFDREEADLFFGRDGAVNEMINKMAQTRFLAVLGASGTGKSSLVRTGLLDGLELGLHPAGARWCFCDFSPGGQPIANLANALVNRESSEEATDLAQSRTVLEGFLRRGPRSVLEWLAEGHLPAGTQLLLLVDQLEELFRFSSYTDREDAEAFVKLLMTSAAEPGGQIHVVVTMRSEFLGACALIPGLAETMNKGAYLTPRMTREECRQAIIGPARLMGCDLEPALVTRLLNDLVTFAPWGGDKSRDQLRDLSRRADQLPVMQHLLNRLWKRSSKGDRPVALTLKGYEALGGLSGALNAQGEEIVGHLTEKQLGLLEKLFRALVDGTSVATATRRPMQLGDLAEEISTTPDELGGVFI